MPTTLIDTRPSEFFKERVRVALTNNNMTIDNDVEFYLVTLLCNFIQPQQALDLRELDTPLALFLKEALESPDSHEQLARFKVLGDLSLYVSGYFQESFNRKTIDIDYYIAIGSSAYQKVATLSAKDLYRKLAISFPQLIEVVAEVAMIPGQDKPIDILATYDRWTRSHSKRLLKVLQELGIDPINDTTRTKQ